MITPLYYQTTGTNRLFKPFMPAASTPSAVAGRSTVVPSAYDKLLALHQLAKFRHAFVAQVELNNGASAIGVSRPGYTAEQAAITQLNNAGLVSSANPIKAIYIAHSDPTKTIQPSEQDMAEWFRTPMPQSVYQPDTLYFTLQWHPNGTRSVISKPLAQFLPIPVFRQASGFAELLNGTLPEITISPRASAVTYNRQLPVQTLINLAMDTQQQLNQSAQSGLSRHGFVVGSLSSVYTRNGVLSRKQAVASHMEWTPWGGLYRALPTVVEAAQRSIEPLARLCGPNSNHCHTHVDALVLAGQPDPANMVTGLQTLIKNRHFQGFASNDTMLVTGQPGGQVAITTLGELFGSV